MTLESLNLVAALPEIWLLCAASLVLMVDLFVSDEDRHISYYLSLLGLLGTAVLTLHGFSWDPQTAFSGMFIRDAMSDVLKMGMYIAVGTVLVYGRGYTLPRHMFRGEWFTLTMFALLGMMTMASAGNLLTLYVGLELLSLALYALVALPRDSARATEAAMKYFVLGALASGMLLYGMSMVYGATGSLDLKTISDTVASGKSREMLMVFGVVFLVTGIGFKLGAVPFHMWVPDVYEGSPTVITMLIGSAPKLAAFAFVIRLLVQGLEGLVQQWAPMLMVLAVLSLVLGNFLAIAQTSIKRMLAYSTISHMGFLLLGVLAGTYNGYAAAMYYALAYALMALAGFGMVLLLTRAGFEADRLADYKGLAKRNPWFAWMMLIVMFSMAGIPVFIGFFAKLSVIQAVVDRGFISLAVIAVMCSLVGAFYYLRVVKLMFMDEPHDSHPLEASLDMRALLSVNCLAILLLGMLPQRMLQLCLEAIQRSLPPL